VGAGAEVNLLGHNGARVNHDLPKAIGVRPIPQTGLMVQRQVPRVLDTSPLVHKGAAVDRGAEAA
jgi:hypothetical protein